MTYSLFGQAAKGWDPVTGLGTPDFGKLKSIISQNNLPPPSTLGGLLSTLLSVLGLPITLPITVKLLR